MGDIRYRIPEETEKILQNVCNKLGMKKSEISRLALMEYLKSLSVISQKVKEEDDNDGKSIER